MQQVYKSTGRIPAELQDAPELWEEHAAGWEAWCLLKGSRLNEGAAISVPEVEAYARIKGLDGADLLNQVTTIDDVYMTERIERIKKGKGNAGN